MPGPDNINWSVETAKAFIGVTGEVVAIALEASQIPGVGAIPGILKLIYATAQEAKGLKASISYVKYFRKNQSLIRVDA